MSRLRAIAPAPCAARSRRSIRASRHRSSGDLRKAAPVANRPLTLPELAPFRATSVADRGAARRLAACPVAPRSPATAFAPARSVRTGVKLQANDGGPAPGRYGSTPPVPACTVRPRHTARYIGRSRLEQRVAERSNLGNL